MASHPGGENSSGEADWLKFLGNFPASRPLHVPVQKKDTQQSKWRGKAEAKAKAKTHEKRKGE